MKQLLEALDLALEALEYTGGYRGPVYEKAITAIKQARALDKKAENARELGLDYEPVAQYSDTVSDGGLDPRNKFDTTPPAAPVQERELAGFVMKDGIPVAAVFSDGSHAVSVDGFTWTAQPPAAPVQDVSLIDEGKTAAPVQEPVAWMHKETGLLRQANKAKGGDFEPNHWTPLYTTPPAAPVQEQRCKTEACVNENCIGEPCRSCTNSSNFEPWDAPPAAQRQWVSLTADERYDIRASFRGRFLETSEFAEQVQLATEAKLKEKNNG
jgi:hypothetical protein